MPEHRVLPEWVRRLLRLCLLTWPADRRRSHGPSLLETVETLLGEARTRGRRAFLREVAGEVAGVAWAGVSMRLRRMARVGQRPASPGLQRIARGGLQDLRLAFRGLLRTPGFTAVVIAILALGIGANAAVFELVRQVLLTAPPYADPDELVLVWNTIPGSAERIPMAAPDVAVLREQAERLSGVAFLTRARDGAVELTGSAAAEHVRVSTVTHNLFDLLGAEAALGRTFGFGRDAASTPAGEAGDPTAVTVAVLAHGTWRRLFGADTAVVGRTVRLNGQPVEVVGVMPPDFRMVLPPGAAVGSDIDLWTPLAVPLASFQREERLLDQDSDNSGATVARLAPGATMELAREEVRRIGQQLQTAVPAYAAEDLGLDVRPLHADATAHARRVLLLLLLGAGAVLFVACLNVAGLVVARAAARSDELAVRVAMGAGRGRILRLVLAESLVLVGLGLAMALGVARAAGAALSRLVPTALAPPEPFSLDVTTVAVAVAAATVAIFVAGLLPGWRVASLGGRGVMGSAPGRTGGSSARVRRGLVVAEVALSVVLLLGAGLLLRTVEALGQVRPGFEPRGALTFDLSLRMPDRYRSPGQRAALMKEIERHLTGLPGVQAVGWVGVLPLSGERWTQPWGAPGQPFEAWSVNRADYRVASSGWFEAVGAHVVEGRSFTAQEDLDEDERVVLVDATLARRIAPSGSAVGTPIGVPVDGAPVQAHVVGVVEPIRAETLEAEGRETIYVPYRQEASRDVSFVVRTAGDPLALAPAVRAAVREVDPAIPVYDVSTLEAYVAEAIAPHRFALWLLGIFAALALSCSAIGLYGVVAFEVSRRTRDIGIRMAVGAAPGRMVRGVLGWGMRLAGAGLLVGMVMALATAGLLRSLVFGVEVGDPPTWLGVAALVSAVTLLATLLPARRASRLDPAEALRSR